MVLTQTESGIVSEYFHASILIDAADSLYSSGHGRDISGTIEEGAAALLDMSKNMTLHDYQNLLVSDAVGELSKDFRNLESCSTDRLMTEIMPVYSVGTFQRWDRDHGFVDALPYPLVVKTITRNVQDVFTKSWRMKLRKNAAKAWPFFPGEIVTKIVDDIHGEVIAKVLGPVFRKFQTTRKLLQDSLERPWTRGSGHAPSGLVRFYPSDSPETHVDCMSLAASEILQDHIMVDVIHMQEFSSVWDLLCFQIRPGQLKKIPYKKLLVVKQTFEAFGAPTTEFKKILYDDNAIPPGRFGFVCVEDLRIETHRHGIVALPDISEQHAAEIVDLTLDEDSETSDDETFTEMDDSDQDPDWTP